MSDPKRAQRPATSTCAIRTRRRSAALLWLGVALAPVAWATPSLTFAAETASAHAENPASAGGAPAQAPSADGAPIGQPSADGAPIGQPSADGAPIGQPSADGAPIDDALAVTALEAIEARYAKIRDLRATFEQNSFTAALGESHTARGRVTVERPGKMRWQYDDGRVIVLADAAIRIYSPEDNQLQIAALSPETLSPTALSFLFGQGDLSAEFDARVVDDTTRPELGLRLVPKSGDTSFERLVLWVDRESHVLRESVVVDVFGNRTSLVMSETAENAGTTPADFGVEVPTGTEVIDLR